MSTKQLLSPINFDRYLRVLDKPVLPVASGVVTEVIGLLIESKGPSVAIGDFCEISTSSGRAVRVQGNTPYLAPGAGLLRKREAYNLGIALLHAAATHASVAGPVCWAGYLTASDVQSITADLSIATLPTSSTRVRPVRSRGKTSSSG